MANMDPGANLASEYIWGGRLHIFIMRFSTRLGLAPNPLLAIASDAAMAFVSTRSFSNAAEMAF